MLEGVTCHQHMGMTGACITAIHWKHWTPEEGQIPAAGAASAVRWSEDTETHSTKTKSETKRTPTASCVADWNLSDSRKLRKASSGPGCHSLKVPVGLHTAEFKGLMSIHVCGIKQKRGAESLCLAAMLLSAAH